MLLIKAYYFLFAAIIYALVGLCTALSWLNRILLEGIPEQAFRWRKNQVPALRWHTHKPVLDNLFRLRF